MTYVRRQCTVGKISSYSGVGIHTGKEVEIRFVPAKEGSGVSFCRVDLPGTPEVPATVEYVTDTARGTTISVGDAKIHTVEHVLSALKACHIDNVRIEISGIEPPGGDGSSAPFISMIEESGVVEQQAQIPIAMVKTPVWLEHGDAHIVALPADSYRISFTMDYPKTPVLGSQFFSIDVSQNSFVEHIASSRTFALYDELEYLMDRGLIRGGSLENAVVVQQNAIISRGGLRYSNEAVRHKILDLIGDLSLVGIPFMAHIIAIRSGHASNCAFAKKLYYHLVSEGK
jgi:UDP-3-O-[3-hydroxymyristoyl] N-acetylglucosamine deacetylase